MVVIYIGFGSFHLTKIGSSDYQNVNFSGSFYLNVLYYLNKLRYLNELCHLNAPPGTCKKTPQKLLINMLTF